MLTNTKIYLTVILKVSIKNCVHFQIRKANMYQHKYLRIIIKMYLNLPKKYYQSFLENHQK